MNLPNKLTVLRMIMVPVMVVFLTLEPSMGKAADIVALVIFCAASFTDYLDGQIARSRNLITDFGKFMDPLADKLLVGAAAICLVELGRLPAWIVVILIGREFVISGFRLVAVDKGIVIAANMWGKVKTVCQMAMTIALLIHIDAAWFHGLEVVLITASAALTLISLATYIIQNKQVLAGGM
jgi:CDP-diacylglycerol--glycerol-3-phosphate 3-phosphatidyltransferase